MATLDEIRAAAKTLSRARAGGASSVSAAPAEDSAWDYVKRHGLSALETAGTVLQTPQAAVYGAIDPESTALEQISKPISERRMAADIAKSYGAPDNWVTGAAGFATDLVADPLNLLGVGVLTKAGKAADVAGALEKLSLAEQGAKGYRTALGLTNPIPFTRSAAIPLVGAKGSERVLSNLSKAALKVANAPVVKPTLTALGDVGTAAKLSLDPKIRMAAKEVSRIFPRSQRQSDAEIAAIEATGRELAQTLGKGDTPNAAVLKAREPIKKAAAKAGQLREAADVTLDASARMLIKKLASGDLNPADLPPEVLEAAQDFRDAQVALSRLNNRAASVVDETLLDNGLDPAEIEKAANEAVDWARLKLSGGVGATPVIDTAATGARTANAILRGAEKSTDIPDSAFTSGAKGSFDFQPDMFGDELRADVLNRRLGQLRAAQATTDPTYKATVQRLEDARQRLAKATGSLLRESQIAGRVGIDLERRDAAKVLAAMQKRQRLLDEAADIEASGARDFERLAQSGSPEEMQLGQEVGKRILEPVEKELVARNILDAQNARGSTYMPNVPAPARDVAEADYAKAVNLIESGVSPDDAAKQLGYTSAKELRSLASSAPRRILDTRLARPTSVNLLKQTTDVAEAQAQPKKYLTGVLRPSMVSAARSVVAKNSYDALAQVHDALNTRGLVQYVDAADDAAKFAAESKGFARLASSSLPPEELAKIPGYDLFEKAFAKSRGLDPGKEIYVPRDIAKMVQATLEPGQMSDFARKANEISRRFIPWFTYNNLAFTGRNIRSGLLYNTMHLDSPSWAAATKELRNRNIAVPFKKYGTGASLVDAIHQGPSALKDQRFSKLFAKTIQTPTGPMTYRQVAEEAFKHRVATSGINGTEFVDDLAHMITGQKPDRVKPWATPKWWDDLTYDMANKWEDVNRLHGFVGGLIQGKNATKAAEDVLKWQVDYAKPLTQVNQNIRAFAPFYRWAQTQLPNMVEAAVTQPGKVRIAASAPYSLSAATGNERERARARQLQAPYQRDRGEVVLPGIGRGGRYTHSLFPESPVGELAPFDLMAKPATMLAARAATEPVTELPHAMTEAGQTLLKELGSEVGGRLNPAIGAIAKLALNFDLYRQKEVAPRGQTLVKAPPILAGIADVLRKNVGISLPRRGSDYYIEPHVLAALEATPLGAKVVNFGGGKRGRPATWDETSSKLAAGMADLILGIKLRAVRADEAQAAARQRDREERRADRLNRRTTMVAPEGESP